MDNRFIYKVLNSGIKRNASDIHLTNKLKPMLRIDGELIELENFEENTPELLKACVKAILKESDYEKYSKRKQVDTSMEYGDRRFRVHVYRQMGCDAFSLRLIPKIIPKFSSMNLPPVLQKFTTVQNGLVLITGTTGSGKSTTLASLIGEINEKQKKHIITVEDPIEFVHEHKNSMINQREVGTDVLSFSDAVIAAMREDPDILLVGEMRDMDTIANAITMAETGHLVFGTLHTKSVSESVDRIIDVFPSTQQEQVRLQLANTIEGIVSQQLLPKVGGGRVPVCEILIPDDAMRNLIREQASPNTITDQMQIKAKKTGSQTRLQGFVKLLTSGLITEETALNNIDVDKNEFLKMVEIYKRGGNI